MRSVAFLIGVPDKHAARTGQIVSETDFAMIDRIARQLDVAAGIVLAVPDLKLAGKAQKVKMADLRQHRESVFQRIKDIPADVVVACGPAALKCLMNKGNVVLDEHLRMELTVPELEGVLCVATYSLEMVAAKPGMEKHLLRDVHAALHGQTVTEWGNYVIIQPGTELWARIPPELKGVTEIGLDLETYPGLDPWHPHARIRMCVVSDRVGRAWVVQANRASQFPCWLSALMEDPQVRCGGSNIKFDYRWLKRFGYTLTNMYDTSTAEHVLDCTTALTDLKSLTFIYCPKLGDYSREHRRLVVERGGWEHVEDAEMYAYCGADGEASIATMQEQKRLLSEDGLTRPFDLSMGLYQVLADMEDRGVCIDTAVHQELDGAFTTELEAQAVKLMEMFGPINLNSPAQLGPALKRAVPNIDLTEARIVRQMSEMEYRLHAKEDPDQFSTDKAILEREAHKHPIIGELLLYRRLKKLYGTYVEGLGQKHLVQHPDGQYYIHTSYRTDKVETSRLSSQGPNLQNIPRKPEPGDKYPIPPHLNVKRQVVSRFPGGTIVEADAGQAEIRVAAHISNDSALLSALTSGLDVHTAMCAQFHQKPAEQVTPLERTHGKRQTFLVLYGGGANTLSAQLGVPKHVAKQMLDQFFQTYPELNRYINLVKLNVKRDLYSESIFGYRRRFRKPYRWDSPEGWHIERQAWNHQVQNAAACITFVAMMDLEKMLLDGGLQSRIIMQVHDSIVIDCAPGEGARVRELARLALEHPTLDRWGVTMNVPLVADIEEGPSWGEKKKVVDVV